MGKRFTDTELWDKQWFMALPPKLKCLVKFVRDKCDVAGIWQPNWMLVKTYIGEKVNEADLLKIDNGNQFKKLPAGEFFCIGFINFQYGELSEKCPPHRKIIALIKKYGLENDRVLLGYQYPTVRVQEEEEDKEEEVDKEKEEIKKRDTDDFDVFWKSYPKRVGKGAAHKTWQKLTAEDKQKIPAALTWQITSEQWTKDAGQFIPHPATYLNQRRWEDEKLNIKKQTYADIIRRDELAASQHSK